MKRGATSVHVRRGIRMPRPDMRDQGVVAQPRTGRADGAAFPRTHHTSMFDCIFGVRMTNTFYACTCDCGVRIRVRWLSPYLEGGDIVQAILALESGTEYFLAAYGHCLPGWRHRYSPQISIRGGKHVRLTELIALLTPQNFQRLQESSEEVRQYVAWSQKMLCYIYEAVRHVAPPPRVNCALRVPHESEPPEPKPHEPQPQGLHVWSWRAISEDCYTHATPRMQGASRRCGRETLRQGHIGESPWDVGWQWASTLRTGIALMRPVVEQLC